MNINDILDQIEELLDALEDIDQLEEFMDRVDNLRDLRDSGHASRRVHARSLAVERLRRNGRVE